MKRVGLAAFLIPIVVVSSVPEKKNISPLHRILLLQSENKFDELKTYGPSVYFELRTLAFDATQRLNLRWQAFMSMVRLAEKESLPEVNRALRSGDWFLRDAAIRVLPLLDKKRAHQAAMQGLTDSALVVRTTSVDALKDLKSSESATQLWNALYAKNNFIKNQSLWIRRHIVEALAVISPLGTEEKFVKVLDDNDSTLFGPAISGLERLTGKKLGNPYMPPVYRRYLWKEYFSKKKTT